MTLDFARDLLESLLDSGATAAEVFVKRGRSRRFERDDVAESVLSAEEAGWSCRAARRDESFFYASTGVPAPLARWPDPRGSEDLLLPAPAPIEGWVEPGEITQPLCGEEEGRRALARLMEEVSRRLPRTSVRATLEEGSSETRVLNHRGVDVSYRARVASLRVEARAPDGEEPEVATVALVDRAARRLAAAAVADRLVDLFAVRQRGSLDAAASTDVVLAPEVAARLIAPIGEAFVDRDRDAVARLLEQREGRVAWPGLSLVDDGRRLDGVLAAPVDGEGVPTGRRTLIDRGRLVSTILPWERSEPAIGCRARPGWRDLPRVAPSQLVIEPAEGVTPADLVADIGEGAYLLDAGEQGGYDPAGGWFSLPVWGWRIARGRPTHPLGRARLVGEVRTVLHAICGVGSDLRFVPLRTLVGSTTLRVRGLTLVDGSSAAPR